MYFKNENYLTPDTKAMCGFQKILRQKKYFAL